MALVENKHDEHVYIKIELRTASELHFDIIVFGESLTLGADRTVTNKDKSDMDQAVEYLKFLNLKIMEEVERDPGFMWTTLESWKSWANSFNQEFLAQQAEENAERIKAKQAEIIKKRLASA